MKKEVYIEVIHSHKDKEVPIRICDWTFGIIYECHIKVSPDYRAWDDSRVNIVNSIHEKFDSEYAIANINFI